MTATQVSEPGRPHFDEAVSLPGVNLVGFLDADLGLGEVARKLGRGLERAGVPVARVNYPRAPTRQPPGPVREAVYDAPFDVNLICLNADYLHTFLEDAGARFFDGRYSIGVWFWETNMLRPDDRVGTRFLDELWVASEYVRLAVEAGADIPVHVVPLPIEAGEASTRTRADLGLPEGFLFLFAFDFISAVRKNPLAVVEAFKRAFAPGEGPVLVLKSMNGQERKPQLLRELVAATRGRPDIHVLDSYASAADKDAVISACDCYVSLHRSEGFGLTIAEAMTCGKPVIATGYSGNLEFMDAETAFLVPYRLVPVPTDWWAYAPGAVWAEPDVDAAAALMRAVHDDPDAAAARGARGRARILAVSSPERTASFVTERLSAIGAHGRADAMSGADPRVPLLRASRELSKGVGSGLRSRGVVRKALARALWPQLAEQHRLDTMTLDAIGKLQRSVDDLGRRVAELESAERAERAEETH